MIASGFRGPFHRFWYGALVFALFALTTLKLR